jgi:acyl-[acyl-carrier-protein] desaturase
LVDGCRGIDNVKEMVGLKWIRQWTGEENRHGDFIKQVPFYLGVLICVEMTTTPYQ